MRALALLAALALSAAANAQAYRWVDGNGHVQYGDSPPPGVRATPLQLQTAPAGAAEPSLADQEAAFEKRRKEAAERDEKARKQQAADEAAKRNCQAARSTLEMLESGRRVRRMNANGQYEWIDDTQRAQDAERARRAVAAWCK